MCYRDCFWLYRFRNLQMEISQDLIGVIPRFTNIREKRKHLDLSNGLTGRRRRIRCDGLKARQLFAACMLLTNCVVKILHLCEAFNEIAGSCHQIHTDCMQKLNWHFNTWTLWNCKINLFLVEVPHLFFRQVFTYFICTATIQRPQPNRH